LVRLAWNCLTGLLGLTSNMKTMATRMLRKGSIHIA